MCELGCVAGEKPALLFFKQMMLRYSPGLFPLPAAMHRSFLVDIF